MNPTKQQILDGEKVLAREKQRLLTLQAGGSLLELRECLISIMEERVGGVDARLSKLRQQFEIEHEKESMEVNQNMEAMLKTARGYVGGRFLDAAPAVCDEIEKILNRYAGLNDIADITQEQKNDDYYFLRDKVKFLKDHVK